MTCPSPKCNGKGVFFCIWVVDSYFCENVQFKTTKRTLIHMCLFYSLFRLTSMKNQRSTLLCLCEGNPSVGGFLTQSDSDAEMFTIDDVIISYRVNAAKEMFSWSFVFPHQHFRAEWSISASLIYVIIGLDNAFVFPHQHFGAEWGISASLIYVTIGLTNGL